MTDSAAAGGATGVGSVLPEAVLRVIEAARSLRKLHLRFQNLKVQRSPGRALRRRF